MGSPCIGRYVAVLHSPPPPEPQGHRQIFPLPAALAPSPVRLSNKRPFAEGAFIEYGTRDAQASPPDLHVEAGIARLSFAGNNGRLRLFLTPPGIAEAGPTALFLTAQLRLDAAAGFKLGLAFSVPGQGWKWVGGKRIQFDHSPSWQDLSAWWPDIRLAEGTAQVLIETTGPACLEFAELRLAVAARHGPLGGAGSRLALRDAPRGVETSALVVALGARGARHTYAVALPELARPDAWQLDGAPTGADSAIAAIGPRLLHVVADVPLPARLMLRPVRPDGPAPILLGEATPATVHATIETRWLPDGRLGIMGRFGSAEPALLAETEVEILTDDYLLGTAPLMPGHDADREVMAAFTVPPDTLRRRRLRLRLRDLGLYFDCPAPTPPLPPRQLALGERAEGALDGLRKRDSGAWVITGWARDALDPEAVLRVDLLADGVAFASTWAGRRHRVAGGGSEAGGFAVEIPPNFAPGRTIRMELRPRAQAAELSRGVLDVALPPLGRRLDIASPAQPLPAPAAVRPASAHAVGILLTQDGAAVLEAMLESLLRVEPDALRQIIVLDHESRDDTAAVLARYARALPLRAVPRPRGSSFANSCNFGASLCPDADILVFLNNDLVFIEPMLGRIVAHAEAGGGIVGAGLLDEGSPGAPPTIQHTGVHFQAGPAGARPFETRRRPDMPGVDEMTCHVPAVTGALMAVHRSAFAALGGFDEGYFYGLEDVDLCLRALAAGRSNLCVNSARAVHLHGHTRRRMEPEAVRRQAENALFFARRWGVGLRHRIRRAQIRGEFFWTGVKLGIGFVANTPDDVRAAEGLARALARQVPSSHYVFPAAEPMEAAGLDLIIILDAACDPRGIRNAGAACTVIAWARSEFPRWAAHPGREGFDAWFAASPLARAYLAEELGRRVDLLPTATELERPANHQGGDPGLAETALWVPVPDAERIRSHMAALVGQNPRVFVPGGRAALVGGGGGGNEWAALPLADSTAAQPADAARFVDIAAPWATAWGVLDGRVLDALAAGRPAMTTNAAGAAAMLPGRLPVCATPGDLAAWDGAPPSPVLVAEVRSEHSYDTRAAALLESLTLRMEGGLFLAIKHGDEPDLVSLAEALRRALEALGHFVRLDPPAHWHGARAAADDGIIALPGRLRFCPGPDQMAILWVVQDFDRLCEAELDLFDIAFLACSATMAKFVAFVKIPVKLMPHDLENITESAQKIGSFLWSLHGQRARLPEKIPQAPSTA